MLVSAAIFLAGLQGSWYPLDRVDLSKISQGWGDPRRGVGTSGHQFIIEGKHYVSGVGTHAPSTWSINLGKNAIEFSSLVGLVDQVANEHTSLQYQIFVDGKLVSQSNPMRKGSPPERLSADLRGASKLRLVVNDLGDGQHSDHAQWIEPQVRLVDSDRPPLSLSAITMPPHQDMSLATKAKVELDCIFVVAADDDGRNGRTESVNDIQKVVGEINRAYACTSVSLKFDPDKSYVRRNDTRLNRRFNSSGISGTDPKSKPPTPGWVEFESHRNKLLTEFPNRIVFLVMRDSMWNFNTTKGVWEDIATSGGWSGAGSVNHICGSDVGVYIHELGHFFGVGHTFKECYSGADAFRAKYEPLIGQTADLLSLLESHNSDGIDDTPPDPCADVYRDLGRQPFVDSAPYLISMKGKDGVEREYELPDSFYNWMSYYPEHRAPHPITKRIEGRFTPEQCQIIRASAESMVRERQLLKWSAFSNAIAREDFANARAEVKKIRVESSLDQKLVVVAETMTSAVKLIAPAEADPSTSSLALSAAKTSHEQVGWGRMFRNRTLVENGKGPFLFCGGEPFSDGIFAHAPSRLEFQLDGKWTKFTTKFGLQSGMVGRVSFTILGDGKVLFNSLPFRAHTVIGETEVSVSGVKKLTLLTNDTGDGATGDWAIWLSPTLHRD